VVLQTILSQKKISIVILSRNHEQYIGDCLYSINREFGNQLMVRLVDVNSSDETIVKAHSAAQELELNIISNQINENLPTLSVLELILGFVDDDYIILISADDALGENYANAVHEIFSNSIVNEIVVNFPLNVTNKNLIKQKTRVPKWSHSTNLNKLKLSIGNPGTISGSVLPWKLIRDSLISESIPRILIEDYWLWWKIVEKAKFINSSSGSVLYRRHDSNTSKLRSNANYAQSLGFICAMPIISNNYLLFKVLSISLIFRWVRHLSPKVWQDFIHGYYCCIKDQAV
jgi:glycosyltransferase involved in cell wall biosynthesis